MISLAPGRARTKARRLLASARHVLLGCSQAPRPAIRRRTSTRTTGDPPPSATSRINSFRMPCFRHPMQVRTGWCLGRDSPVTGSINRLSVFPAFAFCTLCCEHVAVSTPKRTDTGHRPGSIHSKPQGARLPNPGHAWIGAGRPGNVFSCPSPEWRRKRYRCASRSAWRQGGHSGLPCRWRATVGSPGPQPAPNAWIHP